MPIRALSTVTDMTVARCEQCKFAMPDPLVANTQHEACNFWHGRNWEVSRCRHTQPAGNQWRTPANITQHHDWRLLLGLIVCAKTPVKAQVYIYYCMWMQLIAIKCKYYLHRPMAQVLHVQSNIVLLKTRHYFVIYHHVHFRFILTKHADLAAAAISETGLFTLCDILS